MQLVSYITIYKSVSCASTVSGTARFAILVYFFRDNTKENIELSGGEEKKMGNLKNKSG